MSAAAQWFAGNGPWIRVLLGGLACAVLTAAGLACSRAIIRRWPARLPAGSGDEASPAPRLRVIRDQGRDPS